MKRLALFLALLVISCTPQAFLNLGDGQEKSIMLSSDAASATISFNTNYAWSAKSSAPWLTISPNSGVAGQNTITISVSANDRYDERDAEVTIMSEGLSQVIKVTQSDKAGFILSNTKFSIGSDGGQISIPITTNIDYVCTVADDCKDWLSVTKTKALKNYDIVISASKNTSYDYRVGTIEVSTSEQKVVVTITQSQVEELLLETKDFQIGSNGGEIKIPVKTNTEYTCEVLETASEWIEVKTLKTKGIEEYFAVLSVKANTNYDARIGQVKLKISDKESIVTITQSQYDEIIATPSTFEIGSDGGEITVPIQTNVDYEVSVSSEWLRASKVSTKALKNSIVLISIDANTSYDGRVGQVQLSAGDKKSIITITQSQFDEVIVSNTSFEIGSNGGDINIEVEANVDYEASVISGNDWLSIDNTATKALTTSSVIVKIAANSELEGRIGQIQIVGANKRSIVTITQSQFDEIIVVKTSFELGSEGGEIIIPIQSNCDYSLEISDKDKEWIEEVNEAKTKALVDSSIKLAIAQNNGVNTRTAQIKIIGANKESIVTISQTASSQIITTSDYVDLYCQDEDFSIELLSNVEVNIEPKENWIEVISQTKGENNTLLVNFSIQKFNQAGMRTAEVVFSNAEKQLQRKVIVRQSDTLVVHVAQDEAFFDKVSKYDHSMIKNIRISGHFTENDLSKFKDTLNQIEYIDISEAELTDIPRLAFCASETLKEIILPKVLYYISEGAFAQCKSLSYIDIPETVISICQGAFEYCEKIPYVKLPKTLRYFDEYAFYHCKNLSSVDIPEGIGIPGVPKRAFAGSALVSVTLPSHFTTIGEAAFFECKELTTINIPDSLLYIGTYAFEYCSALETITLPSKLKEIGAYAFGRTGLKTLYCKATTPPKALYKFLNYTNPTIYVPRESVSLYMDPSYGWGDHKSKIEAYDF